jgi:hypothetical protein
LELGCSGFHEVLPSLPHITPTLIYKIKELTPFECRYQIVLITPLVFVDASEDSIMVDDVIMLLNLPIGLVEEEELEQTSLDMNVSQPSCK